MDLNFDEEKGIAYIKLSGSLNRKTILGAFDTAVFDKKYKNGMGRLWDFRDADLSSMQAGTRRSVLSCNLKSVTKFAAGECIFRHRNPYVWFK